MKGVLMSDKLLDFVGGGGKYYWLFVAICAFLIVYKSSMPFVSGDDIYFYGMLLTQGSLWHGLGMDMGRFFPLAGWNHSLVAAFSINPYILMLGNAFIFVITAICFYVLGRKIGAQPKWILLFFAIFALSVGYIKITTQIVFPELTQIMFLCLFLVCAYYFYSACATNAFWHCIVFGVLAVCFGNACLYLKEVSLVFIGGFGACHLVLGYIKFAKERKFGLQNLQSQILKDSQTLHFSTSTCIFDSVLILSALIFLGLYAYFTANASSSYAQLSVFSPLRTLIVSVFATPMLSIALPCMIVFRFYKIMWKKDTISVFWDSVALIAMAYFIAFLVLGMASFHYFMPATILACLYAVFIIKLYGKNLKNSFIAWILGILVGFILIANTIPQGVHYFSVNKIQARNTQETMDFLASYITKSPKKVTIYFDGFCRGLDKCYYSWQYKAIFDILPLVYGVDNFDIKSKESNGKNFTLQSSSPLSFFNSDDVSEPQSGDLIVLSYLSEKPMDSDYIDSMIAHNELLFATHNSGYIPAYNLMSFGALVLQHFGIKHSMSNFGNPLRLPSQMYVLRVR